MHSFLWILILLPLGLVILGAGFLVRGLNKREESEEGALRLGLSPMNDESRALVTRDLNEIPFFKSLRRKSFSVAFEKRSEHGSLFFLYLGLNRAFKSLNRDLYQTVLALQRPGAALPSFSLRPERQGFNLRQWRVDLFKGYSRMTMEAAVPFHGSILAKEDQWDQVADFLTPEILTHLPQPLPCRIEARGDWLFFYSPAHAVRRNESDVWLLACGQAAEALGFPVMNELHLSPSSQPQASAQGQ